jgi:hypothetical protein
LSKRFNIPPGSIKGMSISASALQSIVSSSGAIDGSRHKREPRTKQLKKEGKKARRQTELREQMAVFRWRDLAMLKWPELRWLHSIPNGTFSSGQAGAIAKQSGLTRGVSDMFLPVTRNSLPGLYIEMKSEDGDLTPEQEDFRDFVKSQGYMWFECRSSKQAIMEIERYLNL